MRTRHTSPSTAPPRFSAPGRCPLASPPKWTLALVLLSQVLLPGSVFELHETAQVPSRLATLCLVEGSTKSIILSGQAFYLLCLLILKDIVGPWLLPASR